MQLLPRSCVFLGGLLAVALARKATAAPFAYVSIPDDSRVVVVDTATDTPVGGIAVDAVGGAFAVHPSGRRVYVNAQDGVAEIDALTNTVARVIHLGINPAGVAISPAGDRLYVVDNSRNGAVTVIDTESREVLSTVGVGNFPSSIAVSPDGRAAYVTNTRDFVEHPPCSTNPLADCPPVSVIDTVQNQEHGRLNVGINPAATAVDPQSGVVLVAHQAADSMTLSLYAALAIFDPRTFLIDQARLSHSPDTRPAGVAGHPDGLRAYVTGAGGVSVVDLALGQEVAFITVGNGTLDGIAFNHAGTRAYAVDVSGQALAVIDATALSVVASVPLGGSPRALGQFVGPDLLPVSPTATRDRTATPTEVFPACCLNTCAGSPLCGPTAIPTETPPMTPTTPTARCLGDCNGNGVVSIDELLTMVSMALGNPDASTCAHDALPSGPISVADIVTAVNHALYSCTG